MCDTVDFPMPMDPVSPRVTSAFARVGDAMRDARRETRDARCGDESACRARASSTVARGDGDM